MQGTVADPGGGGVRVFNPPPPSEVVFCGVFACQ